MARSWVDLPWKDRKAVTGILGPERCASERPHGPHHLILLIDAYSRIQHTTHKSCIYRAS